ncbi:MAG: sensor histidine kinase, partial [Bradyrhizobium sp.]|nr:sensor histidine kinase [Bradyrhizobium sp.]
GPGSGLGLAIVQDVLEAYGWRLQIGRSELGGARITIAPALTSAAGRPAPSRQRKEMRSILTAG